LTGHLSETQLHPVIEVLP